MKFFIDTADIKQIKAMHIIDCAKIGADVITAPLDVIQALISHPLTDKGMNQFIEDTKKFI